MKKILRILIISAVLLTTAIVFTTCKQFIDNPEEFLGYWSSEVVPTGFSIDKPYQISNDGALCIPSDSPVTTLTIKLHNPRKFSLITPTSMSSAADVQKIINFPGLLTQPAYNTDYTLEQTPDKTALKLTYNSAFLKNHEWGTGNISPEITLTSTDGRPFNKKFSLNLKADTAPSLEYKGVGKTQVGAEWYYVLIFQAKNVNDPLLPPLDHLHGDIKKLYIVKQNEAVAHYTVSGIDFPHKKINWTDSSKFLTGAIQLDAGDCEDSPPPLPTDDWLIYFKTDVKVSPLSALKTYRVRLSDRAGLVSNEVQGSTCMRKVGEIQVKENLPNQGGNGSDAAPYRINCVGDGVDLEVWCLTPAESVKVSYGIKNLETSIESSKEGTASLTNHLKTIRLPAPAGVGNMINYKVTFKADKPGFASNAKSVYYTLTRMVDKVIDSSAPLAWKRLKDAIAEASPGDIITINGEIQATNDSSGVNRGEIVIDKNLTIQGKNGAGSDILNANSGGLGSNAHRIFTVRDGKKLTLKNLTLKDGKASVGSSGVNGGAIFVGIGSRAELSDCIIKACEANNGGAIACSDNSTVSLTNTIINECKATSSNGTGGAIFAARATVEMTGCKLYNNEAQALGGAIYATGATVKMTNCKLYRNTAIGSGGAVYARKSASSPYPKSDVIISGGIIGGTDTNDANKATGPSGKAGGIYIGKNCILTLKDGVQVTGNTAPQGGGVYIEAGSATFTIQDTSIVTPSTGGDATIAGKNDVYLGEESGNLAKITVDGYLSPQGGKAARITVEDSQYKEDTQVLTGSAVNTEHGKFTVTPKNGQDWEVDESGCLKHK